MSVSCDGEYSDVWSETTHKARTQKRCHACGRDILPGERFGKTASLYDGSWDTTYRCRPCQAIYEHLQDKCQEYNAKLRSNNPYALDDRATDVALDCGLEYEEEWGPCPDEIAALAFALPKDFE